MNIDSFEDIQRLQAAHDAGWKAYWNKADQDTNPYTDEDLRDEWNLGFVRAFRADQEEL